MITSATSRRTPAETKAHLTRSFDGLNGSDIYRGNQMKGRGGSGGGGRGGGGVGLGRDVSGRQHPTVYDAWNDDITSSQTDGHRSLKYIHTTNYPDKQLLMRRAKSATSLHNWNGSVSSGLNGCARNNGITMTTTDLKGSKVTLGTFDRQTQTAVNRYTQTPVILTPNEYNTYYHQLLSSINRYRSPPVDFAPVVNSSDVKLLESFVMKHGPATYRFGGKGAPWRHLKMTCGVSGENIMFVDGTVKENDSRFFPPTSARRWTPEVPAAYLGRPISVIQY